MGSLKEDVNMEGIHVYIKWLSLHLVIDGDNLLMHEAMVICWRLYCSVCVEVGVGSTSTSGGVGGLLLTPGHFVDDVVIIGFIGCVPAVVEVQQHGSQNNTKQLQE